MDQELQEKDAINQDQRKVLEAIFGTPTDDAFGDNDVSAVVDTDTPEKELVETEIPADPARNNDGVRYQYWQSEAQKAQSEAATARAEADYFKRMVELGNSRQTEDPEEQVFPDPPTAPKPPVGYNYEEALSNPQSPSAQYVAQYQEWQTGMLDYSLLKTQYLEAVMREKFESIENEKAEMRKRSEQEKAYGEQISSVRKEVMDEFGIDAATADDFIEKMSQPGSLNIQNLYKLYISAFQEGSPQKKQQPSDPFAQAKKAASFGPAFTDLPNGQSEVGRSNEYQIFDSILALDKRRTDW